VRLRASQSGHWQIHDRRYLQHNYRSKISNLGSVYVYFAITDGLDEADIRIRLIDSEEVFSDDPTEVMSIEGKIEFPSPLAVVEGVLGVGFELPTKGVYHCELRCGDSVLMSRRLLAATAADNPSEPEHPDG